jgi:hypothetical protein
LLRDCDGADSVIEDDGRIAVADGLLAAARLAVGRLADLRVAGRDFGEADLGLEPAEFGVAFASGMAAVRAVLRAVVRPVLRAVVRPVLRVVVRPLAVVDLDLVVLDLAAVLDAGRADEADGRAAGLRVAVDLDLDAVRDVPAAGLADDIVLAAAVSALAAVVMALVAVFIACMADDIVFADAVALVAAAVILVAAEVTLVAAEDTVLAADVGVAELRLAELRLAVPRLAVLRLAVLLRAALGREAVVRDAVDRDAVLRVDRDPVLRAVVLAADLRADVPAVLRLLALGVALDVLEPEFELGRLAVPFDALRLTDLLRAVLAELRRVAARVVD